MWPRDSGSWSGGTDVSLQPAGRIWCVVQTAPPHTSLQKHGLELKPLIPLMGATSCSHHWAYCITAAHPAPPAAACTLHQPQRQNRAPSSAQRACSTSACTPPCTPLAHPLHTHTRAACTPRAHHERLGQQLWPGGWLAFLHAFPFQPQAGFLTWETRLYI